MTEINYYCILKLTSQNRNIINNNNSSSSDKLKVQFNLKKLWQKYITIVY